MSALIETPAAWERWGWMVASVAARHGVTTKALLSRKRTALLAQARHELMADLWGSGLAYIEVGRLLGMHLTSVMHGVKQVLA